MTLLRSLLLQWYPVQIVKQEEPQPAYLNVIIAPFALTSASRPWAASSLRAFDTTAVVPTFGSTTSTLHYHIHTMKTSEKTHKILNFHLPFFLSNSSANRHSNAMYYLCSDLCQLSTRLVQRSPASICLHFQYRLFAYYFLSFPNAICVHSITGAKKALSGFACSSLSQFDYRFSLSEHFIWRLDQPFVECCCWQTSFVFYLGSIFCGSIKSGTAERTQKSNPKLKESDSAVHSEMLCIWFVSSTHLG